MEQTTKKDLIIVDALNLFYRTSGAEKTPPALLKGKEVYLEFFNRYITMIEKLLEYLTPDGVLVMTYDGIPHRYKQSKSFFVSKEPTSLRRVKDPNYKVSRRLSKESQAFYNTMDLARYYLEFKPRNVYSIASPRIEADDFVKPLIDHFTKEKQGCQVLLVSNDSDWYRWVTNDIVIMDGRGSDMVISNQDKLTAKFGFPVDDFSITMFKCIFGDASDDVEAAITPKSKQNVEAFKQLLLKVENFNELEALILDHNQEPFLKLLHENFLRVRINLQLVGSIPISPEQVENRLRRGSDKPVVLRAIKNVSGFDRTEPGINELA